MLGADDDQSFLQEIAILQRTDHLPDRGIDKLDGIGEVGCWCGDRVGITGNLELLPDADRLEVHAKDCRDAQTGFPGVVETIDLVESSPHFEAVVKLDSIDRACDVAAWRGRDRRCRKIRT